MKTKTLALAAFAALGGLVPASTYAAISTLEASGWNSDIVFTNNEGNYNNAVTGTLDNGPGNINGYSYYESGSYPNPDGVVQDLSSTGLRSGTYISATGSGATFQFQDFTQNNALLLQSGDTGTLVLDTAVSVPTLALYGTTGAGNSAATVTLNFTDGTSWAYSITEGSGITHDWYKATDGSTDSEVALTVGGRVSNRSEEDYTRLYQQQSDRISIYETLIDIDPEHADKLIASIDFEHTGTGGNLAIFAVSGGVIPEPATSALVGLCGLAGLLRRRRA